MGGCRQLFYHYMNNKAKANGEEMGPKLSSIRHQELVSITDPGSNLGIPSEQASSFSSQVSPVLLNRTSSLCRYQEWLQVLWGLKLVLFGSPLRKRIQN